jgi:hypothetical protein
MLRSKLIDYEIEAPGGETILAGKAWRFTITCPLPRECTDHEALDLEDECRKMAINMLENEGPAQ